ncbi:uncharacterized protein LOC123010898 [Tribolium madens]|uniref:uncharacterized protein LOC123010898 n=1 Tax=Tribolium madens TaxID=41895 RepID=UPI001CF73D68|nr:uncharacterized protein LOC123010898 [Tribolium madens]
MNFKFGEPEEQEEDYLEVLKICFIDAFRTHFAKLVLGVTFVNIIGLTLLQTYFSINSFSTTQFLKYAPIYFGRFHVLVCVIFIWHHINVTHKLFAKIPRWSYNTIGKIYNSKVKRNALYTNMFVAFITLAGFGCAVLYAIPTDKDEEIFFILSWFEENMLEWADIFSLGHRLSFLFVSVIMQAPSIQICYIVKQTQYQLGIVKIILENIHQGFDNLDTLILDDNFQKEMKKRLVFCVERHINLVIIGKNLVKEAGVFVFLLAVTGAMWGVSLMMFFYVTEDTPTFVNVRLCALIFVSTITGILYVIQGQNIQDVSEECFQTVSQMDWYYWNEENKRIYQIMFLNCFNPFTIKFSENLTVNYKLGIELAKAVYSMMSFMTYVSDKIKK